MESTVNIPAIGLSALINLSSDNPQKKFLDRESNGSTRWVLLRADQEHWNSPQPTMADNTQTQPNGASKVQNARTSLLSKEEQAKRRRQKLANRDYGRGKGVDVRGVRDKKLRTNMKKQEEKYQNAISKAKDAEILLENAPGFLEPEHELERTYRVRQDEITSETAVGTAQKRFDLKLDDLGPYQCEYTRNGRELLLAGRKGHIATMDFREGKLGCELQLGETIRGRFAL